MIHYKPSIQFIVTSAFILLFLINCDDKSINYTHKIVKKSIFYKEEIKSIGTPEKVLLLGYLAIYGNECTSASERIKCKILSALNIDDECSEEYQLLLQKWFKNDIIKSLKLKKCPNLSSKSAIQNKINKIEISRNKDTIQIIFSVTGMNTSQEKNWNIEQTERFLIINNTFLKLN